MLACLALLQGIDRFLLLRPPAAEDLDEEKSKKTRGKCSDLFIFIPRHKPQFVQTFFFASLKSDSITWKTFYQFLLFIFFIVILNALKKRLKITKGISFCS